MGRDTYQKLLAKGIIEIAPLAYMRGRTLGNAFVILDEGQNTTGKQMKMFLTRLGYGSKMVVTGDCAQADLPRGVRSGLAEALTVLRDVRGVGIARLTGRTSSATMWSAGSWPPTNGRRTGREAPGFPGDHRPLQPGGE